LRQHPARRVGQQQPFPLQETQQLPQPLLVDQIAGEGKVAVFPDKDDVLCPEALNCFDALDLSIVSPALEKDAALEAIVVQDQQRRNRVFGERQQGHALDARERRPDRDPATFRGQRIGNRPF